MTAAGVHGEGDVPGCTQVVVSGGGPVGLVAAIDLARHGIEVVVVEPRPQVSRLRPRAKTLNMRTLEHLRRLGLADDLRERAELPVAWCQSVSFRTRLEGDEITRFDGVFGLADPEDVSPEFGQQQPQYVLEELLRDVADQTPGIIFLRGARVTGLLQDAAGVRVEIGDAHGAQRTLACDYVLGADGARSAVRDAIGAAYVGSHALTANLGVVFRTSDLDRVRDDDPAVQYWLVNADAPGMMGPIDLRDTWWFIGFGVDTSAGEVDVPALIDAAVGRHVDVEVLATDPWTARMELVDSPVVGRVALIGDAAHLNPPFGGHGLNTGIGDAIDVAWKIRAMLDGWGGSGLLDTYTQERRPLHELVIAEATRNMSTLSHDLVRTVADGNEPASTRARLVDEIRRKKTPEFYSLDLVLGHRYGSSDALQVAHDSAPSGGDWARSVAPGRRLPHVWLAPGRSTLDAVGDGMTLYDTAGDAARWVDAARELGVPFDVAEVTQDAVPWDAPQVLVRPDGYVAWAGHVAGDPAPILARSVGRG